MIWMRDNEKWMPQGEARRSYHLKREQLELAISEKVVRSREEFNNYSEQYFTLVSIRDLEANLEAIKSEK